MARRRIPSVRTLQSIPWLEKVGDATEIARAARKILLAWAEGHASRDVTLHDLNDLLGCFGVVSTERFSYLNTGDTYTPTILFYFPSASFRVTSWGDVVEADERRGFKYR